MLFEIATRNKYRFPFRGQCSTEDLWDLNVQALDSIYQTLTSERRSLETESLLAVSARTAETQKLDNMIEIVKHVVTVKLAERDARAAASLKAERKQQLLGLIEQKQNEQLGALSVEELQAMVESL